MPPDAARAPQEVPSGERPGHASLGKLALIVACVVAARALLDLLTSQATFPLAYGSRNPLLLAVFFVDALFFGAAHVVKYLFAVSFPLLRWELGALQTPLSLMGFVVTGSLPAICGLAIVRRWRPRAGVLAGAGVALGAAALLAPLLLVIMIGLVPYAVALLGAWLAKGARARAAAFGLAILALAPLNVWCGFFVLIQMVPSM